MAEPQADTKSNTSALIGRWKLDRQECFDEFLAENGVNWFVRKMARLSSPEMEIKQDGDKFHIILKSSMMTKEWKVQLGVESEDVQMSGAVFLINARLDDDKLVMEMTPKEKGTGKPQTHTRHVENGELFLTMQVGNVTAKRIFKKLES